MTLTALKVDGGACANNYLTADDGGHQQSAGQAALLRGDHGAGRGLSGGAGRRLLEVSTEDVLQNWAVDREFTPGITEDERAATAEGLEQGGAVLLRLGEGGVRPLKPSPKGEGGPAGADEGQACRGGPLKRVSQ